MTAAALPDRRRPVRRPERSLRSALVALVAGAFVVASGVGCSSGVDGQADTAATSSKSTPPTSQSSPADPATGDTAATSPDMAPTSAPLPAGEIVAKLVAAQRARDLCALLAAVQIAQPNPTEPKGALAVYAALDSAVVAMKPSVPAELVEPWTDFGSATSDGLTALRAARGNMGDPEFRAAFRRTASVRATELLERYQRTNCR